MGVTLLTALGVLLAAGCGSAGIPAGAAKATSSRPGAAAPSESVPSSTASTGAATPTVTDTGSWVVTDQAVVARWGQQEANAAMQAGRTIALQMATSEVVTGKITGARVLDPMGNSLDDTFWTEVAQRPKARDSLMMGNAPFTITAMGAPAYRVGQPKERMFVPTGETKEIPLVEVPVQVWVPITVTGEAKAKYWQDGTTIWHRSIVLYLTHPTDRESHKEPWLIRGFDDVDGPDTWEESLPTA